MTVIADFERQLAERLDRRRAQIESEVLPRLQQRFVEMQSGFGAIYNVLKRKGVLKEDPYQYEERHNDLKVPEDAPYSDNERDSVLGMRLGGYQSQLALLSDYYDFSLENLDLKKIRELARFVKYIDWGGLSQASSQPTTRGVAELIARAKQGTDQLSNGIVNDSQNQLVKLSSDITGLLKHVTTLQRELYKYQLRSEVMPHATLPEDPQHDSDAAVRAVKAVFSQAMPGRPFAKELVLEVLAENDPDTGEKARRAALRGLDTGKESGAHAALSSLKPMLLDAARTLAVCSRAIDEMVGKATENATVLESRKLTLGEWLRIVWRRMRGKEEQDRVYLVEYLDETTNTRRSEEINFDKFVAATQRRARVYAGIMAGAGAAWQKLQSLSDDQLLQYVTKDTAEVVELTRRFQSLDTYFRTEVPREKHRHLRGVNVEVTTIRDNVSRARKRAHEFVAKTDEREQLRKLGITPTS